MVIEQAQALPSVQFRPSRESSVRYLFRTNPMATLGAVALVLAGAVALAGPLLPLPDPTVPNTGMRLAAPMTSGFALGADELGRDILSRLVWGARVSLLAGAVATLLALIGGVVLGLVAGYAGGAVDEVIMRVTDVVMAFPTLLLAIAVASALGPSLLNAMLAVAFVGFPFYARLLRASVLSLREREFVTAARALGASDVWIVVRHVLPNVLGQVVVAASLDLGSKIIATASLSFLGLGTQPPTPDWGNMLATGRQVMTVAAHVSLFPGLAIFLIVVATNLFGDGLRDALDPRMR